MMSSICSKRAVTLKLVIATIGFALVAPTAPLAQTAEPRAQARPGAAPTPQRQARPPQPAAPAAPATTTSQSWWGSMSNRAAERRLEEAKRKQAVQQQQQQSARAQAQAQQADARKARRAERRVAARRAAAARRAIVRRERETETADGVLRVATGSDGAASRRPGDEVARALGETKTVTSDGRRALSRGRADLAVAPSLDGGLGRDGDRVAKLFDAVVLVIAPRDVRSPNELAGKPVEIGDAYGEASVARAALETMGVNVDEQRSAPEDAFKKVASGESAAAVVVAVKGSTVIGDALDANPDLHLVSVTPNVAPERATRLTRDDIPAIAEGEAVHALSAEISLFARRGRAEAPEVMAAVKSLYGQIPQLMAGGAGAWWRSVPLATEATDAQGWTPIAPDLASEGRDDLAEGLERVRLERAVEITAAASRSSQTQGESRRLWVVGP